MVTSSIRLQELLGLSFWLKQNWLGAQLQDVWSDEQNIIFELYLHRNCWLVASLDTKHPQFFILQNKPEVMKKKKPVTLFLQSHAKNLRLQNVFVDTDYGRVLQLKFASAEHECDLRFILIPRLANLLVTSAAKKISWSKPVDLPRYQTEEILDLAEFITDDFVIKHAQAWGEKKAQIQPKGAQSVDKLIEKKRRTLLQIQEELSKNREDDWQRLGDALKYRQELSDEQKQMLDSKRSLVENQERAYQKAKDTRRKREGTLQRLEQVKNELVELERKLQSGEGLEEKKRKEVLLENVKSRKMGLAEGRVALIGKSAEDNLAILRQARAWDLWLHLRDYPSAHVIIFRNKGQAVPHAELEAVAQWLIKETLGAKNITAGVKYSVVFAECRFVKPVKGAKGMVTYQNAQSFIVASK